MLDFRMDHAPALRDHLASEPRSTTVTHNLVNDWVAHPNFEYDLRRLSAKSTRKTTFNPEQMRQLKSDLADEATRLVSTYDSQTHGTDGPTFVSENLVSFVKEAIQNLPRFAASSTKKRSKQTPGPQTRIGLDALSSEEKGVVAKCRQYYNELTHYFSPLAVPSGNFATLGDIFQNATIRRGITRAQLGMLRHFSDHFDANTRKSQLFDRKRGKLILLQKDVLDQLQSRESLHSRISLNQSLMHVIERLPQVIQNLEAGHNIHPETIASLGHLLERFPDTLWAQDLWDRWSQLQMDYEKASENEFQISSAVRNEIKRDDAKQKIMDMIAKKRAQNNNP